MNGNFGMNSTWGSNNSSYNPVYIEDYWDFLEYLKPRREVYFQLQNDIDLSMLKLDNYSCFPINTTLEGSGRRLMNLKLTVPLLSLRGGTTIIKNVIFDNLKCDNPNLKHPLADFNFEQTITGQPNFKYDIGDVQGCIFILNDEWTSSEINFLAPVNAKFCLYIAPSKTVVLAPYNNVPPARAHDATYMTNNYSNHVYRVQNFKIYEQVKNQNFYGNYMYVYESSPRIGSTTHGSIPHSIIPNNKKDDISQFSADFQNFIAGSPIFYLDSAKGLDYKKQQTGKYLFKVSGEYYTVLKPFELQKIEPNGLTEQQLVSIYGTLNLNSIPQRVYKQLQEKGNVEIKTLGSFVNLHIPTLEQLNFTGTSNKQTIELTNTNINRLEV